LEWDHEVTQTAWCTEKSRILSLPGTKKKKDWLSIWSIWSIYRMGYIWLTTYVDYIKKSWFDCWELKVNSVLQITAPITIQSRNNFFSIKYPRSSHW